MHYTIRNNVCIINLSTFIYGTDFNWCTYSRCIDNISDLMEKDNSVIVKIKNVEKLLEKMNCKDKRGIGYRFIQKIFYYTYNILVSNSNRVAILNNSNVWNIEDVQDLKNICEPIRELINKYGLANRYIFSNIQEDRYNRLLHEIVDERFIK